MATKGSFKRRKPRRLRARQKPANQEASQEEQATAPAEQLAQAEPSAKEAPQGKPTIRKGIFLSALIYVEGDMPAPGDFIVPATSALKWVLEEALKGEHNGLSMTLKEVEVRNDVEQDDGEEEGPPEEKFQF